MRSNSGITFQQPIAAQIESPIEVERGESVLCNGVWSRLPTQVGAWFFWILAALFVTGLHIEHFICSAVLVAIGFAIYKSYGSKHAVVTNKRLVFQRGWLNKHIASIPLEKIDAVKVTTSTVAVKAGSVFNNLTLTLTNEQEFASALERARASRLQILGQSAPLS